MRQAGRHDLPQRLPVELIKPTQRRFDLRISRINKPQWKARGDSWESRTRTLARSSEKLLSRKEASSVSPKTSLRGVSTPWRFPGTQISAQIKTTIGHAPGAIAEYQWGSLRDPMHRACSRIPAESVAACKAYRARGHRCIVIFPHAPRCARRNDAREAVAVRCVDLRKILVVCFSITRFRLPERFQGRGEPLAPRLRRENLRCFPRFFLIPFPRVAFFSLSLFPARPFLLVCSFYPRALWWCDHENRKDAGSKGRLIALMANVPFRIAERVASSRASRVMRTAFVVMMLSQRNRAYACNIVFRD